MDLLVLMAIAASSRPDSPSPGGPASEAMHSGPTTSHASPLDPALAGLAAFILAFIEHTKGQPPLTARQIQDQADPPAALSDGVELCRLLSRLFHEALDIRAINQPSDQVLSSLRPRAIGACNCQGSGI